MDAIYWRAVARVTVVNIGASSSSTTSRTRRGRRAECSRESRRPRGESFSALIFQFCQTRRSRAVYQDGVDDREHGVAWRQKYYEDFTAQKYHKAADEYSPDADLRAGVEDLALLYAVGAKLRGRRRFRTGIPIANFAPRVIAAGRLPKVETAPGASRTCAISGARAGFSRLRARLSLRTVVRSQPWDRWSGTGSRLAR